jgi:hypothetical protein
MLVHGDAGRSRAHSPTRIDLDVGAGEGRGRLTDIADLAEPRVAIRHPHLLCGGIDRDSERIPGDIGPYQADHGAHQGVVRGIDLGDAALEASDPRPPDIRIDTNTDGSVNGADGMHHLVSLAVYDRNVVRGVVGDEYLVIHRIDRDRLRKLADADSSGHGVFHYSRTERWNPWDCSLSSGACRHKPKGDHRYDHGDG